MIGAFKDTKEEAKELRRYLKKRWPKDDIGYTKTKFGFYYVWHEKKHKRSIVYDNRPLLWNRPV